MSYKSYLEHQAAAAVLEERVPDFLQKLLMITNLDAVNARGSHFEVDLQVGKRLAEDHGLPFDEEGARILQERMEYATANGRVGLAESALDRYATTGLYGHSIVVDAHLVQALEHVAHVRSPDRERILDNVIDLYQTLRAMDRENGWHPNRTFVFGAPLGTKTPLSTLAQLAYRDIGSYLRR